MLQEIAQPVIKKLRKKRKSNKEQLTTWDYNPPTFFYERLSPKSCAQLCDLAREMLAWASHESSLVFSRFFSERKCPMSIGDVYEAMERCEKLKDAVTITKQILAGRREQGSIEYKYNFAAIRETQPLYDPEYRAWKIEAIKNTADHIEKIVVLPAIPKPEESE